MEDRDKKTELLVGLFLTAGLIMLGLLILQFGSVRELFKSSYQITVPFPDATGVKEGTPVFLGGSKIGKVPKIPSLNANFNGVIVTLEIYKDKRIPSDAKFSIGTAGFLGDAFIEIRPTGKETASYIAPGAVLTSESVNKQSGLSALTDTAQDIGKKVDVALEDLRGAVKDLDTGLTRLNSGALSDKSMKDLQETIGHLNNVMTRLDTKTLGDDTSNDLKAAVSSLKDAARNLNDEVKRLGPMFDKLDPALAKADKLVSDADKAMLSVNSAFNDAGKTMATLSATAKDIRSGNGLLPALISDEELKENFKSLIRNLRQRGILFYKDKPGEEPQKQRSGHAPGTDPKH